MHATCTWIGRKNLDDTGSSLETQIYRRGEREEYGNLEMIYTLDALLSRRVLFDKPAREKTQQPYRNSFAQSTLSLFRHRVIQMGLYTAPNNNLVSNMVVEDEINHHPLRATHRSFRLSALRSRLLMCLDRSTQQ
jgi:hypothetical protein